MPVLFKKVVKPANNETGHVLKPTVYVDSRDESIYGARKRLSKLSLSAGTKETTELYIYECFEDML